MSGLQPLQMSKDGPCKEQVVSLTVRLRKLQLPVLGRGGSSLPILDCLQVMVRRLALASSGFAPGQAT